MTKMLRYLKPGEWLQVLAVMALTVAQVWLDLRFPDYMAEITKLVQTPGSRIAEIGAAGAYMLLCALVSLACVIAVSFFASRLAAGLAARLRAMIFDKAAGFSMEEVGRFSTASLITRSTNDVVQVQTFFMAGLQMLLKVPILILGGVLKIAGKGYAWTLATVYSLAFMLIAVALAMRVVLPIFDRMQSLVDALNLTVRESLAGRFVTRAFNAEEFQLERFSRANHSFTAADQTANRTMAVMGPATGLARNGLLIAIYCIGATMIVQAGQGESLTAFSNTVVMSSYAAQVMTAVKFITKALPRWPRASVSARRINELLQASPALQDGVLTGGMADVRGEVSFQNVAFRYPGAADNVLEGVSFTARQGETVAFIGSTGSGKTTLINLALRFYDATEGHVLVDGVDVRNYARKSLYNKIAYVPQKALLFRGTVSSNIAFGDSGRPAGFSPDDVRRAIETAQGLGFVDGLEGALDASVAQGGAAFSGGQRQRLSIARALYRKPEILIFDDSWSSLDYKTERDLRDALKRDTAGVTKLVIAQRIASIMDADRIIVLDEGRIVGQGAHQDLLQSCRVYREIAMSQLSEEELAS